MPSEPVLTLRGVSRRYRFHEPAHELKTTLLHPLRAWRMRRGRPFYAVRDVSLEVCRGEFLAIVGANGSGKSTLLRLMAGLSRPSSGSVQTAGRLGTLLELGSGFHPQVSGRENTIVNGLLLGMRRSEVQSLLPRIVAFAGLQQFIDQPMRTYSSGMQLRLGFAIAAFGHPEVLLVDEVLAVGDARFQEKCYDHIEDLRERGVTIVMVTHDLGAVERFASRAALMEQGRVVLAGSPKEVVAEHLRRLATASPEIQRALDDALDQNPGALVASPESRAAFEAHIGASAEARARFDRALEANPEFHRALEEKLRGGPPVDSRE